MRDCAANHAYFCLKLLLVVISTAVVGGLLAFGVSVHAQSGNSDWEKAAGDKNVVRGSIGQTEHASARRLHYKFPPYTWFQLRVSGESDVSGCAIADSHRLCL